ncbi:MAG TPA: hybrid sensor histidine kinase/response regulator [Gemmataceae bacterium]|nr:hybrid sensor histidine kinase/response regulator [Gemmataceae bacterium]
MADKTAPTLLVVDDNPATLYATSRTLRAVGFTVVEATTGAEALAAAGGADLVLLDVHLPDADGRDVCRELRARPSVVRLPIVHVSAVFVADLDKVLGLEAGADAYLTRPVDPSVLVATVKALLRARDAEERAVRLRDDFLAAVSHELRTPISVILIWGRALRRALEAGGGTPDPAAVRDALDAIEQGARAQQRLVEDLLDTSRIASGTLRVDVGEADLAAVVRAAVQGARAAAAEKGVELDPGGVGDGRVVVRADAGRMEQVVWNLLDNAIKFTPAGGRVAVALGRGEGTVEIRVTDTGRGIAAEFLPHVFNRFSQADTGLTAETGGLGLGLAIAREIVALHGGTIRAASDGPGRGATFIVELPSSAARGTSGPQTVAAADVRV